MVLAAIRINGWRYSGQLDHTLLTKALCSGFIRAPPECKTLVVPALPTSSVAGVSVGVFVAAMLVIIGAILALLVVYKRFMTKQMHTTMREEIMLEVQAEMERYRPLGQDV